jgi:uncharacterized protein (TIGR03437 family)
MGHAGLEPTTRFLIQLPETARSAVSFFRPSIYTNDGGGAVVVHNGSLVTSDQPLQRGGFAFVYASGLGPVIHRSPREGGAPLTPTLAEVTVTLGGLPCEVQFAGLAPGFGDQVYQVNFLVPPNAPVGSQDLVIAVGGVSSRAAKVPVR